MSNIVPMNLDQIPAHARGKSAVAEALSGSLAGGVRRLSIKGGTFRYIVGGQEIGKIDDRYIDLVMVNAAPHIRRTWYAKSYEKDAKPEMADCWSADGAKPDPSAKNKQHVNCVDCPKNAKGSGNGDSRACRFSQLLAVVLANDISGEVLQLSLPATSIFGEGNEAGAPLQKYYKALSARGIDPAALVTRAKFDTEVESPKLGFSAMRWLDAEEYAAAIRQGQSEAATRAVTMSVAEADGVDAGRDVPLPSGAPPVASAPAETPVEKKKAEKPVQPAKETTAVSGAADEPVVRKNTDVVPAQNEKLASLIDSWATDD